MLVLHESIKNVPKSRVELHIHLDGAIRLETLLDLIRRKNLPQVGDGSIPALREALRVSEPSNLASFLGGFDIISPATQGDTAAIERISREFVEDRSRDHVAYCEARFCPHLLLSPPSEGKSNTIESNGTEASATTAAATSSTVAVTSTAAAAIPSTTSSNGIEREVTLDDIMEAVLRGIAQGEKNCPGTKVRLLLCCIRGMPQWSWEVLRLCEQYRDRGVLGIDIAGSHLGDKQENGYSEGAEVFQTAAAKGIRRTVHAGEDVPAESVSAAVTDLMAERIGHGYRVLEDEAVYKTCKDKNIHFEVCPHSSYLTGSIKDLKLPSKRHPVIRFAEDGASFSINTDDPSLTLTRLEDEYSLLRSWGFTEAHFARANFNAALQSFLPPAEKQALLQQLREAYGVAELSLPSPSSETKTKTSPNKPNITVNTWEDRD